MKYTKSQQLSGKWVNKKELHDAGADRGIVARLVTEAAPSASNFKDEKTGEQQMQDVAKVRFDGYGDEPVNVSLNKPTINALVDAFGEDSKDWMGKTLTAMTEKTMVSGKRGYALYLIPEGYEMTEDAGGYIVIVKKGEQAHTTAEVKAEDLPF